MNKLENYQLNQMRLANIFGLIMDLDMKMEMINQKRGYPYLICPPNISSRRLDGNWNIFPQRNEKRKSKVYMLSNINDVTPIIS